jgi:lactosylceramide 4-alpha-galactosyltransferase
LSPTGTLRFLFCVLSEGKTGNYPARITQEPTRVKLPTGPVPENAINFFITEPGLLGPKMREFCPIEAAAKLHPDVPVVVHLLADHLEISSIVQLLNRQYKNIAYLKLDVGESVKDTPLEGWFDPKIAENTPYRNSRLSDIARATTVYKYGGWYLDSDLMVIRRIANLRNCLALVGFDYLPNNNFLAFDKGHPFLKQYLEGVKRV